MKIYKYPKKEQWIAICKRPAQDHTKIMATVARVTRAVKGNGDKALHDFNKKFDGVVLQTLSVTKEEMTNAIATIDPLLKKAILQAKKNIETFHLSQKEKIKKVNTQKGVTCWRESRGIEKVGLYIPGGAAPLFSTVLMLGIPAAIAGCKEIILCTPCNKKGNVHPAILYAASLCNISKIYKTGGAQAIAAMAYGTQTISAVHKIFGPGNQYVTAAKQLVKGTVAIDMPAGPSEVLIIADNTANAAFVAADMLAQAEHGPDSQVVLITTEGALIKKVEAAIKQQLKALPRKDVVAKALIYCRIVQVKTMEEAIAFSNFYAPEHLMLSCKTSISLLTKIINAGSVFIGSYSPESAGDYASGTNHTLPTNGHAAAYSGVSVDSFVKKITFQQLTHKGLQAIANTVTTMAEAEGLQAHSNAITIRMK